MHTATIRKIYSLQRCGFLKDAGFFCFTKGPYGATIFRGGVLEKIQIYTDKRMAIQVFMQIKDHAQQV